MVKRIVLVCFVTIGFVVSVFAGVNVYEQFYSYESAYSLGIGRATTTVEGLGTVSFLANPATGISKFSFELTSVMFRVNDNGITLLQNLNKLSGDQAIGFLIDQVGKPMNFGLDLGLISFNIPVGDLGLSFGIANVIVNGFLEAHNPLSTAGFFDLLLVVPSTLYIGGTYSFRNISTGNSSVDNYLKLLNVGLNLKFNISLGVSENIALDDIVSNTFTNINPQALLSNISTRFVPDIGFLYRIPLDSSGGDNQRVNIGLSIKDIGGITTKLITGNEEVFIPTTFNIGASYFVDLYSQFGFGNSMLLRKNYFSLDFHDLFLQRKDKDFFRRLHIGISSQLFNLNDILAMNLGLGVNGGYPTFGISLKLTVIKIEFAVYTEELGVYAGQDPDTRYVGSISIGW